MYRTSKIVNPRPRHFTLAQSHLGSLDSSSNNHCSCSYSFPYGVMRINPQYLPLGKAAWALAAREIENWVTARSCNSEGYRVPPPPRKANGDSLVPSFVKCSFPLISPSHTETPREYISSEQSLHTAIRIYIIPRHPSCPLLRFSGSASATACSASRSRSRTRRTKSSSRSSTRRHGVCTR